LAGGQLDHEVPYGMAWVLVLDAEAARSHVDVFGELAIAAADRIVGHLDALQRGGDLTAAAFDAEYPSATWATVALRRWGLARRNTYAIDAADRAAALILGAFPGGGCEPATTRARRGFVSPVHLAVLLAADLGRGADPALLDGRAGFDTDLLGGAQQPTVHSAGLNFSRAWGLYGAWRLTRKSRWRDAAARLIIGHAAQPERWRDDYARYAHWGPAVRCIRRGRDRRPALNHYGVSVRAGAGATSAGILFARMHLWGSTKAVGLLQEAYIAEQRCVSLHAEWRASGDDARLRAPLRNDIDEALMAADIADESLIGYLREEIQQPIAPPPADGNRATSLDWPSVPGQTAAVDAWRRAALPLGPSVGPN